MAGVPGLMRLGLTVPASKKEKGWEYKVDLNNNVVAFDKTATGGVGPMATQQDSPSRASTLRKPQVENFIPPKFALAGQKLTFKGFFQESVPESPLEASRQRHLALVYYLEDDSVEVMEPFVRNDGLLHGKFLKRMKIPDVSVESLRIGNVVEIFSKAIHVYACDEFTRKFYDSTGNPQPDDEHIGVDTFTATQARLAARNDPDAYHGVKSSAISRFVEVAQGSTRTQSFKKDIKGRFLEFDGIILRFHIVWIDKYGDPPVPFHFWLSYFMSTDEVEIREVKGCKYSLGSATLLKRQRLPMFTMITDDRMRSVEDVTGDEDYYNENHFRVGGMVHVFGRDMKVLECDEFSQKWYKANKGIDQNANRIVMEEPKPVKIPVYIPPHIGIGSEEDTLASFKSLIPKKPKLDFKKWRSRTGKTTKFMCRMVTDDPINCERVFRITYFHDDDEIAVFEPPVRNSGISAGVFTKKKKLTNPATGEKFKVTDFVAGQVSVIKAHKFYIIEEERQPVPAIPEVEAVVSALKKKLLDASSSLRKMFRKFDLDKSQTMSYDEFFNMLNYYSLGLTKYEAIVLFKSFEDKPGFMSYANFMVAFDAAATNVASKDSEGHSVAEAAARLQSASSLEELDALIDQAKGYAAREEAKTACDILLSRIARNMKNTKGASDMHSNFRRFDVNKDHLISPDEFREVMGHGGLYLSKDEIEMMVTKFYEDEEGNMMENLDYMHFMHTLHVYAEKVIRS